MGVFQLDITNVDASILKQMQNALYHRGPDDSGLHTFTFGHNCNVENCGIAFDRLSIRDLSENGHQPMFDNAMQVMIAFNGEIYNSEELRPALLADGITFRGHSDTEVILNLYIKVGLDKMLEMLDGMYAICIFDKRINKIFLIRDRIGEKPLYIYQTENVFLFASEFKAFYAHPKFKPEINQDVVDEYFLFRYSAGNDTILKGVTNLEPGSYLEFANDFNPKLKIYWKIPAQEKNNNSFEENKRRLNELLKKSVRRRLISDVPIGIQLSGGIDSSYLAYIAKQNLTNPMHAYSIIFDNAKVSEEKYIDFVNRNIDFKLHKYNFKASDFLAWWKKASLYFEQPMNHEGTLALGLLNKEASKDITVMLCGDGPDESMGGYTRFYLLSVAMMIKSRYGSLGMKLLNILKKIRGGKELSLSVDNFISRSQYIPTDVFNKLRPWRGSASVNKIYCKRRALYNAQSGIGVRKALNYEMYTYMQDILMRTDKISMASSIEVRVPYLMPELLEFVSSIPDEQLVGSSWNGIMHNTKMPLKSLANDVFGSWFTYRPKEGLSFPFSDYFSQRDVVKYVEDELLPKIEERRIVDFDYVKRLWVERKNLMTLWTIFSFEIWAQIYIDGNPIDYIQNSRHYRE
jgi:asparagine synthase (glutamine-hydrolysing)